MKKTVNKWISILLTAGILISLAACGQKNEQQETADTASSDVETITSSQVPFLSKEESQKKLDKLVKDFRLDGTVIVSRDGDVICRSVSGKLGQEESSEDITDKTLFCVASISKQFVASAVMQLCEAGKMSVDDTLEKYYPEYVIGKDISIKNMLSMRSGIEDFYTVRLDDGTSEALSSENLPFDIYAESDAYYNKGVIKEWLFNQPLSFEPDTNMEYSNSNYFLLADIVEQVSGTDYHTYIKENIFEPLGMENSGFLDDYADSPELAKSTEPLDAAGFPGVTFGAGDIVSTADDMDKWLTALRTHTIISESSYNEMSANYSADQEGMGYGYGLMLPVSGGVMHLGALGSYRSVCYTDPKTGCNIFAVTNNCEGMVGEMTELENSILLNILK